MEQPLVSIIVPIYNAQKALRQCVDSILNQTYENIECILVNDGSKDDSGSICDEYASKDIRVKVIHKENSGVSDTRNMAISNASGEYLQFVDADDWLTLNATETLVKKMIESNCEMVISDFYRVVDNRISSKGSIEKEGLLSKKEFALYMMEKPADFYYGVLWNKLYKKSIIDEYQLNMDPKISWSEDFIFNLRYISHIQNIYVTQVPIYYYVRTKNSLVSQSSNFEKTVQMKISVFEYYHQFYKEILSEEDYKKYRIQIYRYLLDVADDGVILPFGNETVKVEEKHFESVELDLPLFSEKKLYDELFMIHFNSLMKEYHIDSYGVLLLNYIHKNRICTRKQLSSALSCSIRKCSLVLQNLKLLELITFKEIKMIKEDGKEEKALECHLLPNALLLLEKVRSIYNDMIDSCFHDFSQEEIQTYKKLTNKLKRNIDQMNLS